MTWSSSGAQGPLGYRAEDVVGPCDTTRLRAPADPVVLQGDPRQLEQLVRNLVSNAVRPDLVPEGRTSPTAGCRRVDRRVSAARDDQSEAT